MRLLLIVLILLVGCKQEILKEDIQYMNGYWEIETVGFKNGETKDFMPSTTIDFIELEGMKGFRKKVQPKFNGTFETSNDAELFTITKNESLFELNYQSNTNARKERLLSVSENNFTVVNQDSISYSYKRYQPMNLDQ